MMNRAREMRPSLAALTITVIGGAVGYGAIMESVAGKNESQDQHMAFADGRITTLEARADRQGDKLSDMAADIAGMRANTASMQRSLDSIAASLDDIRRSQFGEPRSPR